jgi:hypothetical protein
VSGPGPAQTITVVNTSRSTAPPVIVTSLRWETIKVPVGKGKKAKTKSETVLDIQFSGLLGGSGDLAAYELSSVTTKKVKKRPVTTFKPIRLTTALAASSGTTSTVALLLSSKPNLSLTDRLQITANDLTDTLGRALDGNGDGQPGGNFVATFGKQGVSYAQPTIRPSAPAN